VAAGNTTQRKRISFAIDINRSDPTSDRGKIVDDIKFFAVRTMYITAAVFAVRTYKSYLLIMVTGISQYWFTLRQPLTDLPTSIYTIIWYDMRYNGFLQGLLLAILASWPSTTGGNENDDDDDDSKNVGWENVPGGSHVRTLNETNFRQTIGENPCVLVFFHADCELNPRRTFQKSMRYLYRYIVQHWTHSPVELLAVSCRLQRRYWQGGG